MLSSISPLGERARNSRWWVTVTAYGLGSLLGGLTVGSLAAALGTLLPTAWRASSWALGVVALLIVIGLLLDLRLGRTRLPTWRRQVDEAWLARYRGWVYGLGFGTQLGFGLVTIVTSSTTYAMVGVAVLCGWPGGLWIGLAFGLVRALPTLFLRRVERPADLHRLFATLEKNAHKAELMARVALAAGAISLLVTAARS